MAVSFAAVLLVPAQAQAGRIPPNLYCYAHPAGADNPSRLFLTMFRDRGDVLAYRQTTQSWNSTQGRYVDGLSISGEMPLGNRTPSERCKLANSSYPYGTFA